MVRYNDRMKGIFVVRGHGLSQSGVKDNGATGHNTSEWAEAGQITRDLQSVIEQDADLPGVIPIGLSRRMSLKQKIGQVNTITGRRKWSAEDALLVSIHLNSARNKAARGVETWYSAEEGTRDLAIAVTEEVAATTGLPIRKYPSKPSSQNRHKRLGILDDTIPRGVLVECGFLTNEFDAKVIKDEELDDKIAEGIYNGIRKYLGLAVDRALPVFYSDVPEGEWYHEPVKKCLDEGLLIMKEDGLFRPDTPVTRAEMCAMFSRFLKTNEQR